MAARFVLENQPRKERECVCKKPSVGEKKIERKERGREREEERKREITKSYIAI